MITSARRFTVEKRARLLGMVEAGLSVEAACAACDVTALTVRRWRAQGLAGKSTEHRAFAAGFEAARAAAVRREEAAGPLSREEVLRLLERQARAGSVRALELLLKHKSWEDEAGEAGTGEPDPFDELDRLADERAARGD